MLDGMRLVLSPQVLAWALCWSCNDTYCQFRSARLDNFMPDLEVLGYLGTIMNERCVVD